MIKYGLGRFGEPDLRELMPRVYASSVARTDSYHH